MSDSLRNTQLKLEFSVRAVDDLEEIWLYVAADSGKNADKLLRQITEKCSKLLGFPKIGKERNDLFVGLRSFPAGNFIIFYQETDSEVEIVRIIHSSRDIRQIFEEMIPLEP